MFKRCVRLYLFLTLSQSLSICLSPCISSLNATISRSFIFHLKSAIMTDTEDTVFVSLLWSKANDLFSLSEITEPTAPNNGKTCFWRSFRTTKLFHQYFNTLKSSTCLHLSPNTIEQLKIAFLVGTLGSHSLGLLDTIRHLKHSTQTITSEILNSMYKWDMRLRIQRHFLVFVVFFLSFSVTLLFQSDTVQYE